MLVSRLVCCVAAGFLVVFVATPVIPGPPGLVLASLRPWSLAVALVLLAMAGAARTRTAFVAGGCVTLLWVSAYLPALVPEGDDVDPSCDTFSVLSQNVATSAAAAGATAAAARQEGADIVAMQELDGSSRAAAAEALREEYGDYMGVGTVGFWSRHPVRAVQALDLGLGWDRAISAEVDTPAGTIGLYVVHVASVRLGNQAQRDRMLAELARTVSQSPHERILIVGDFNAGSDDRSLAALKAEFSEPNQASGGFGFTWPATFPAIRLDHVFQRGLDVASSTVLARNESDHLPNLVTLRSSCSG